VKATQVLYGPVRPDEPVSPSRLIETGSPLGDPVKRTIMRPNELSDLINVPAETLKYWRRVAKGPRWYRLEGARIVYDLADVESWLDEQRRAAAAS
jgi:hypothetical protein